MIQSQSLLGDVGRVTYIYIYTHIFMFKGWKQKFLDLEVECELFSERVSLIGFMWHNIIYIYNIMYIYITIQILIYITILYRSIYFHIYTYMYTYNIYIYVDKKICIYIY